MPCLTWTAEANGWHGRPLRSCIRAIYAHTTPDLNGGRYFRRRLDLPLQKLKSPADFVELNRILEVYR